MADLKTKCSACNADIVVWEGVVSEDEDATYKCAVCAKL